MPAERIERLYLTPEEAGKAIGRDAQFIRKYRDVFDLRRIGRHLFVPVSALANLPHAEAEEAAEEAAATTSPDQQRTAS